MEGKDMTPVDHRGSGWTLWREIYGTFLGVLPLIIALVGSAIAIIRDSDRHEIEINHLKAADIRHEQQLLVLRADNDKTRTEIITSLHEIVGKLEGLEIKMARVSR